MVNKNSRILYFLMIACMVVVILLYYLSSYYQYNLVDTFSFILKNELQPIDVRQVNSTNGNEGIKEFEQEEIVLTPENSEWEKLNNNLVIRRSAVFYYKDDDEIKVMLMTEPSFQTDIRLIVDIFVNKRIIRQVIVARKDFTKNAIYEMSAYSSFMVNARIKLEENEKNLRNLKMYLTFADIIRNTSTKTPINIQIKSKKLNNKEMSKVETSALCSQIIFAADSDYESLKWWIEINKHLGYKKLMFFNSSIPHHRYSDLFEKHKNFLEVRKYNYVPRMVANEFIYITFRDIYDSVVERFFQENFAFNECFCTLFNDYDRVAVYDRDELIIPRNRSSDTSLDLIENSLSLGDGFCNYNIDTSFNEIKSKRNSTQKTFYYWFHYILPIDAGFAKSIFSSLENIMNNTQNFSQPISIQAFYAKINNHVSFKIEDSETFNYAKSLLRIYKLYNGEDLSQFKDVIFNRVFMLEFNEKNDGKSAHEYEAFQFVGHHLNPYNYSLLYPVPYSQGYAGHFRTTLNLDHVGFTFSLKNLKFDFFYYNCILKQLGKILT